jgi:hypothetical protein
MPFHPSSALNFYFGRRPYQGADANTAVNIFIGEDPNFAPEIEAQVIWPKVAEYLLDGGSFWAKHAVHHPFLLPGYNDQGRRYHRWFDRVFNHENGNGDAPRVPLPASIRDSISFVELLNRPTVGAQNIHDPAMLQFAQRTGHIRWLAGLIFNPPSLSRRTVFITKTAASILGEQLALMGLNVEVPTPDQLNLHDGPWHQVFELTGIQCRLVIHYHPTAHYPAGGSQRLRAAIRKLLLDGPSGGGGNGGTVPPVPPQPQLPPPSFEPGSFAEYFYNRFLIDLQRIEKQEPNSVVRDEIMRDPSAIFFGGPEWRNVSTDLPRVPLDNRGRFILSLFMVTLTEQVIYTHCRNHYEMWRAGTGFPKFGWSGYGPHHENPFILLWAPEREGIFQPNELLPLLPEFVRFYLEATASYFRQHLPAIQMTDFLRRLVSDPQYQFGVGTISPAFRTLFDEAVAHQVRCGQ